MAILTTPEIAVYAPSVTATGAQLDALVSMAMLMIESPSGSNCPIEKQVRREQRKVGQSLQTVQLSYWSVYPTESITLQGRFGNVRSRYRVPIGISAWETILPGSFLLDETGHLSLNTGNTISGFDRGVGSALSEIKIQYLAGVDFTLTTPSVIQLKAAFGAILTALFSGGANYHTGQEIIKKSSYLEVEEGYAPKNQNVASTLGIAGIADYLLFPFQKYRPRGLY